MASVKYVQITSFSSEDINAMANEIARINNESLVNIKRAILGMNIETDAYVEKYELNLIDLIKIIEFYDYPIKFRIEYLDGSLNSSVEESKKKYIDEIKSDTFSDTALLEKQIDMVKDEYIKSSIGPIAKVEQHWQPPKQNIDPNDIPDFK